MSPGATTSGVSNSRRLPRLTLVAALALFSLAHAADAPRQLEWDELAPKLPAAQNPFASLRPEQLEALRQVAKVRDNKARDIQSTAAEIESERSASERLRAWRLDADALLARRDEVAREMQKLAGSVNNALDGKLVRIPGYVLPLEMSGKEITEFLLVPWVGACIHTPPPPLNQIVHVKTERPVEVKAMFDAVWVTGRITTNRTRTAVYISDGSAEVDVGYDIASAIVERY